MKISDETLHGIIRDYGGVELSAEELELVRPEIDFYAEQAALLDAIDCAGVMSARLLRTPAADLPPPSAAPAQGGE